MECSAALSGALTALRHDEEARLNKKVEKVREEEKVCVLQKPSSHLCSYFTIKLHVQVAIHVHLQEG